MQIDVRQAQRDELSWINDRYSEIGFMHSNYDTEIIALAIADGHKAGMGRLVDIDDMNRELGGIYVLNQFRGEKIATKIVQFLITKIPPHKLTWCVPFVELAPFYYKYGFSICKENELKNAPEKMLDKLMFCKQEYEKDVTLLVRKPT